jgi:hypothetical protein
MLPRSIGQGLSLSGNPLIGRFLAAGRAKAALAAKADLSDMGTGSVRANKVGKPHHLQTASEYFNDVIDDRRANRLSMFGKIAPPDIASLKEFFNRANSSHDCAAAEKIKAGMVAKQRCAVDGIAQTYATNVVLHCCLFGRVPVPKATAMHVILI